MPTYEYACRDCGDHFEIVQSFRDDALTDCPACDGSLRKVFSAAGIIFKGSGWHVKDYADSANGASASNGSKDSDTTSGDGGTGDGGSPDGSSSSSSTSTDTSSQSSGTADTTSRSA